MIVDINKLTLGEHRLTERIEDVERLTALLGSEPATPFEVNAVCVLGDDGLHVELSVKGTCYARCDLCGEATTASCYCSFEEDLTEGDKEFDYVTEQYVLDGLVDECIIMSAPHKVRCKEDCKGLCPHCGANLNYASCSCKDTPLRKANPFSALQDIILTGGAKNGSTKK